MESLKKTLKPYGSHKSARSKISTGDGSQDSVFEELPILLAQQSCSIAIKSDQDSKNNKNKMMKDKNDDNNNNDGNISGSEHDPPSQLIRRFLDKQKIMTSSVSSEMGVDMDLKMDGLPLHDSSISISISNSSTSNDPPPTSYKTPTGTPQYSQSRPPLPHRDRDTSNSALLRTTKSKSKNRSKSRLLDPEFSHPQHQYSNLIPKSSGQLFYSFLGTKKSDDDDDDDNEDDPFSEEYLPDEYKNRTHFSLWVLLEWLSLICIIAALIANLCIPSWKDKNLWDLRLWKWEVMILVLICGRLVSDWVIRIVVFCIERNFVLRKKVLYFVYGVKKAVQNCLWSGLVLIAWHSLFDKKRGSQTKTDFLNHVTKVLLCFFLATVVWLLKTLLVKVLASSFHMSTYFDRIQESLFNQFIIETLSGPPTVKDDKLVSEVQKLQNAGVAIPPGLRASAFPKIKSGVLKSAKSSQCCSTNKVTTDQDNEITIDHLHKLNPKNVSAWNMKRLINMVRNGALSTLDEHIPDDSTQGDDESIKHIKSENEAKAAAKKIFHNVARPSSRYIYLEDLMHFMQEDEAMKTMNLFEGASETSQISKSALKNWVVNAFRERRALALTLNDTKTAVINLHRILNVVVAITVVIIWLLIFQIATSQVIMFVMSQTLLSAFVFGSTCRAVFESVIFLFIMHPFDVGDRCEIDNTQLVVEEMNILTTIFLRDDNAKVMIPNSVLATKPIYNFYRSPDMGDAIDFFIHVSTPAESIALLKQRILSYINNKKDHWHPSPMIVIKEHESLNMIRIAIWLCHTMNFQDMGERYERRSLLIEETIKIFKELDIHYRLLPLDINIRSMPVTSARLPPSWATITSSV
ncbi:hypothetical protein TanjilG_05120 [Lupinus angustifolius]|uniref:Mechanosensitive ion channel protein n=1 Tax=Lupinus angustifolius TaxID=3871 RepID=A0A1J7H1R2_LUPAN|nr:PREDICTED: mechanosensitive ion channel protein 6-like [Lupinus angustifolius]OIV96280.1 hypothetical protein TanjilG_05120 [Lupinus angustifolius]